MEGNERSIYMDAPVCVRATRTGRQDEHGCYPFPEQRLRQLAKDPQSTWEDSDLARCFGDLRRGTSKLEAVRKEKRSTKDHD